MYTTSPIPATFDNATQHVMGTYTMPDMLDLAEIQKDIRSIAPDAKINVSRKPYPYNKDITIYRAVSPTDEGELDIQVMSYAPNSKSHDSHGEILRVAGLLVGIPLYRLPHDSPGKNIGHAYVIAQTHYRKALWPDCDGLTYKGGLYVEPHKAYPARSRHGAKCQWTRRGKRCPSCSIEYRRLTAGDLHALYPIGPAYSRIRQYRG